MGGRCAGRVALKITVTITVTIKEPCILDTYILLGVQGVWLLGLATGYELLPVRAIHRYWRGQYGKMLKG